VYEVDQALGRVTGLFVAPADKVGDGTTIVAFRTGHDIDTVIPTLRRLTEERPAT